MERLIVGFKTCLHPAAQGLLPPPSAFDAPSNYKDPVKIEEYKLVKAEAAKALAGTVPYLATFDEVQIVRPGRSMAPGEAVGWSARSDANLDRRRRPFGPRAPVAVAIRNWLLSKSRWPDAWPHSTHAKLAGEPRVVFIGFDVSLFLKMLGIECSLPENQPTDSNGAMPAASRSTLPLGLWYDNPDAHRDIGDAVLPGVCGQAVTWDAVLRRRGLREEFPDWQGPHVNVKQDASLIARLGGQLGMFDKVEDKQVEGNKLQQAEAGAEAL